MNRKALALVMAGVLSASAAIPAFATSGGAYPVADGTDVYAGIMLKDPDARVKVEVPTLFAFVVNGSVLSGDDKGVTSTNGGIMLPNVKVNVTTPSDKLPADPSDTATYEVAVIGDGSMEMKNYSTKAAELSSTNTSGRTGLKVKVNGNIKNEGEAVSRNYWEYVGELKGTVDAPLASEFKKYIISVDGNKLSTSADGGYELDADERIELAAPANIDTGANLDTDTNLALNPTVKKIAFGVEVGGAKNQYKQVEESAKVGTIVWTVSAEVEEAVYTAPDNDYLDGVGEDGWQNGDDVTDPDDIELVTAP